MAIKEVKREKWFDTGIYKCVVCGKGFHLYWNSGELEFSHIG